MIESFSVQHISFRIDDASNKVEEGAPKAAMLDSLFQTSTTYLKRGVFLGLIAAGFYISSYMPMIESSHGLNVEL